MQMAASHHMQMSAEVKAMAGANSGMQMRQQQQQVVQQQQQQTMFYPQQQQQQQQGHSPQQQQGQQQAAMGVDGYSYSASQTQTINFTQQHLRANTRMPGTLTVQQQQHQQQQAMHQQQVTSMSPAFDKGAHPS